MIALVVTLVVLTLLLIVGVLIAFAVHAGQEVSVEVRAVRARRQVDRVVDDARRRLADELDFHETEAS